MNQQKLANGLRQLGEAVYEIADALLDTAIDSPTARVGGPEAAAVPAAAPADTYEASPFEPELQYMPDEAYPKPADFAEGSEAICPKHRVPFADGKYGLYCQRKTDDPAWADRNGFCKIKPANAAKWLQMQAAAA